MHIDEDRLDKQHNTNYARNKEYYEILNFQTTQGQDISQSAATTAHYLDYAASGLC